MVVEKGKVNERMYANLRADLDRFILDSYCRYYLNASRKKVPLHYSEWKKERDALSI